MAGSAPELRDRLRRELTFEFNSCLANLYRDGTDSMGYSDNEPELGLRPSHCLSQSRGSTTVRAAASDVRRGVELGPWPR